MVYSGDDFSDHQLTKVDPDFGVRNLKFTKSSRKVPLPSASDNVESHIFKKKVYPVLYLA